MRGFEAAELKVLIKPFVLERLSVGRTSQGLPLMAQGQRIILMPRD